MNSLRIQSGQPPIPISGIDLPQRINERSILQVVGKVAPILIASVTAG